MSPLTILWSIAGSMCLMLGIVHGTIWLQQGRQNLASLLFTFAALGAAASSFMELWGLHAESVETYALVARYQNICIFTLLLSLIWFVYVYFGTAKRWLALTITGLWILSLIINFLSPYSLTFSKITGLKRIALPWGEDFAVPIGSTNPWTSVPNFASALILIFAADASVRLWRRGDRRRAGIVGGSILFFIIAAGVHTPLVDEGIIKTPYMISFAFLAIIFAMGFELIYDVLQASILSSEVKNNERRWRALLDNVQLLVAGIDHQGNYTYINPFFCSTLGYTPEEIRQRHFTKVIPSTASESIVEDFQRVMDQEKALQPHREIAMRTKEGESKQIVWSSVTLFDRDGHRAGALSIGADVTAQREAEGSLKRAVDEIHELKEKLQAECLYLREEINVKSNFGPIIGDSDALKYVLMRVEQVAQTESTVLLLGETGVGKELVARAIHDMSRRSNGPLVKVNCSALPETLVESELFGHERGAFTGADRQTKGRFELADGGTILLDEVGELPATGQAKLLRVLQEGELERIGGGATIKVNVRIVAATNRNLNYDVATGRFRQDLFYRLNVYPITIPPLRQRRGDIPRLVEYFVREIGMRMGKEFTEVPSVVMQELIEYHWPGNVRELQNVIERAVIISPVGVLRLPEPLVRDEPKLPNQRDEVGVRQTVNKFDTLDQAERQHILRALEATGWRISGPYGAAAMLKLNPSTLRFRMKKLGLSRSPQSKPALQ
jgi:PAS domain S-box-containing protein